MADPLGPTDPDLTEAVGDDSADHWLRTWEVPSGVPDVGDSGAWETVVFAHTSILSHPGLRYTCNGGEDESQGKPNGGRDGHQLDRYPGRGGGDLSHRSRPGWRCR